ncbi:uncharacterized protein [Eurosta solidaginis]|uniref:uncharacterized protein n=1 Tax=Eurosta solidaginis TaxID=178769 RepID=UPI0035305D4B
MIDAFTKFVKLDPTNSTSTKEVTAALDKYFSYYSRPSAFRMNYFYIYILLCFIGNRALARIVVRKVIVRIPRPKDIGLIFDLTVINTPHKEKETLEFRVSSNGFCCVNLTENTIMEKAGRVVGGNFGYVETGTAEVVSLIWPTVSLYNRVGSCPITVTSVNAQGIEKHQRHSINFDTRFTTLDPEGRTLRSRPDYKDCMNWDKEYLKNCTPVNCQERYFGQRGYYNKTTEHCDEVPRCDKKNMHYDFIDNVCVDMDHFFTKEDLRKIKNGEFIDEYKHEDEEQKKKDRLKAKSCGIGKSLYERYKEQHENTKRAAEAFDEEFNRYMQSRFVEPTGLASEPSPNTNKKDDNDYLPYWLKGVLEGLVVVGAIIFLQVIATIAIYILICFVIFLIVTWISRRQFKGNNNTTCVLRSPEPSDIADEPLITPSSLLSQR